MRTSFSYSVYFPDDTEKEIDFDIDFAKDGIGSYEFAGQKCYDAGEWNIEDITWDETGLSLEEIRYIDEKVTKSWGFLNKCWESLGED